MENKYLNYHQLQENTRKYAKELESTEKKENSVDMLTHLNACAGDVSGLIITNLVQRIPPPTLYILRIDTEKVEFSEIKKTKRDYVVYTIESQDIYLNNKKMSHIYLSAFQQHIRQVISDLEKNNALVYEEKKSTNAELHPGLLPTEVYSQYRKEKIHKIDTTPLTVKEFDRPVAVQNRADAPFFIGKREETMGSKIKRFFNKK